jgi:hypothetical protein
MTPKSICFCGDASAFSRSLAGGIADAGFAVERFERADDLERVLDESCAAVVIVNPHLHQAKAVRAAMRTAGGWASRVPFIAALDDIERVAEIETLKHFEQGRRSSWRGCGCSWRGGGKAPTASLTATSR